MSQSRFRQVFVSGAKTDYQRRIDALISSLSESQKELANQLVESKLHERLIFDESNFQALYQQLYDSLEETDNRQVEPDGELWRLDVWSRSIDKIKQMGEGSQVKFDGPSIGITCRKCGGKDISERPIQIRAADEGQTIFRTCKGCGERFHIG